MQAGPTLAVVLFCALVGAQAQESVLLRAFIIDETKGSAWVQPGGKNRQDSARDLARALNHKGAMVAVTKDEAEADFTIEITGREEPESGKTVMILQNGVPFAKKLQGRSVSARVKVRDLTFEFVGTTSHRYWSAAAEDLAKDIERWAKDNQERLLAGRAQRCP